MSSQNWFYKVWTIHSYYPKPWTRIRKFKQRKDLITVNQIKQNTVLTRSKFDQNVLHKHDSPKITKTHRKLTTQIRQVKNHNIKYI